MWKNTVFVLGLCSFFIASPGLFAQPQAEREAPAAVVSGQRDVGVVLLSDFSIKDGVLSFRAATGGCTDKTSFRINVKEIKSRLDSLPHHTLTIERIKADDCKGMFPEGVLIQFDLAKDLGLTGEYTLSIANPMTPRTGEPY